MDVQSLARPAPRRLQVAYLRWGAIIAGTVVGISTYLLLALFGAAVGLIPVGPEPAAPEGVTVGTGVWTVLSITVATWLGGHVAGRLSGMARRMDGVLHGFVAWGTITILFASLTTTPMGTTLGGAFGTLGEGIAEFAQFTAAEPDRPQQRLQLLLGGPERGVPEAQLGALAQALEAGDREAAVAIIAEQIGIDSERAGQLVQIAMPWFVPAAGEGAAPMVSEQTLGVISGWLFAGLLLSLGFAVWGGIAGVKTIAERPAGEHLNERHLRA